jgi:hypothetical protein
VVSDCSEPCAGVWDPACTWCACAGNLLTGVVLTSHNTPLANVTVSPAHAPFVSLTVTGPLGGFYVADVCVGQRLLFTHPPRYLDLEAEVTSVTVTMQVNMQDVGEWCHRSYTFILKMFVGNPMSPYMFPYVLLSRLGYVVNCVHYLSVLYVCVRGCSGAEHQHAARERCAAGGGVRDPVLLRYRQSATSIL